MLHHGELVELDVDALPFAAKPQLIQLPARVDAPGPVYPLVFVVTVSTVHGFTQGLGRIGRVRKRLDLGRKSLSPPASTEHGGSLQTPGRRLHRPCGA